MDDLPGSLCSETDGLIVLGWNNGKLFNNIPIQVVFLNFLPGYIIQYY